MEELIQEWQNLDILGEIEEGIEPINYINADENLETSLLLFASSIIFSLVSSEIVDRFLVPCTKKIAFCSICSDIITI